MKKGLVIALSVLLVIGLIGCSQPSAPATEDNDASEPSYPEKAITLLIPFSAGGGSDIMGRTIAKIMQEENILPQQIMVENKPGGSGSIGWSHVASKVGDPYIISTVSSSFWTTPLAGNSPVSYKDFTPISALAMDPFFIMVKEDSPYKDLEDLVEAAKAKPGELNMGGTAGFADDIVCTGLLEDSAEIELNYVPFEGGGDVMTALLGGHVDVCWANPGEGLSQIEAKKARPLAVSTEERLDAFPDVPTFKELGYDVVFFQFRGVVGPKDMPGEAVQVLEQAFKELSECDSWTKDYLEANMVTPRYLPSEEFGKAIVEQNELYFNFFKEAGMIE